MMLKTLTSVKVFLAVIRYVVCDDVFGCGGFVKSDYDINYSRVEIKLYTKHGSLKYHTDCAPHNGYYLIPVYDKGDYILKIEPPVGWNFEPSSVPLHIDGVSDPCSLNKDINFVFKGFTLKGQVLSNPQLPGPAGIKLVLKDSKSRDETTTVSVENGHYQFPEVYPGVYSIKASHEKWHFKKPEITVNIADSFQTMDNIIVFGYDVRGSVFSDGEPIAWVNFLLFSANPSDSPGGCNAVEVKGFNNKVQEKYLCYVTSHSDGTFVFDAVPPGAYKIIPFYKREHIEFDVSPSEVELTVVQNSILIQESFQIKGFTVSGWVGTRLNGKSLADVKVLINGEVRGTTDNSGFYHLENMRTGSYELHLQKSQFLFDSVVMEISPNTPRLPDIYVSKFLVSGHVQVEEYPSGLGKRERNIFFSSEDGKDKILVPVQTDGDYLFEVKAGKYIIQPEVMEEESSLGLKFVPEKQILSIIDDPYLNINFRQFRAVVRGKVKCVSQCEGVVLDLAKPSDDVHMKAEVSPDGTFEFQKCLPGNYILSVMKDDWCFQSKTVKFIIIDKDIMDLEFNQIGFQATIILTHDSKFEVKYPSGDSHIVELQKSKNLLCLPEKGTYEIIPISCHLYNKVSYTFDSDNPSIVNLSPIKHLVAGNILTELNVTDIKIFVKMGEEEVVVPLQKALDKKNDYFKYPFSVFAEPNSELELKVTSKQLLFRPVITSVKLYNDCLENAVEIIGKIGRFLNGSVTPPIEGVNITVYLKESNILFTETVTDKDGYFLVGPLEDESDYVVNAQIDGYIFTPLDGKGKFQAFKLAEILVEIINEDGSPLPGALLSLSGGSDYRKNSVTQADGKLSFSALGPGQYFLRPMLKEFSFDPSSKMIDIQEGTQIAIKIKGKRVAYSLYGIVTSLTGEAEVGVAVEAVGLPQGSCSQYQEEAISEQGGAFRIRGLQPNCEYKLHLKPGSEVNQHIERAAPKEVLIKVTNGDISGVRLIVFRYYGQMDVSGNVMTNDDYLQTLKVRLFREDEPDQVIHSLILGQSSFFYLPSMPIDNRIYVLQLESTLSTNSYSYYQPSVTFCANTSFYHFTFNFEPRMKSVEQEVTQGSVLALPLTIIILLIVYNYSKLLPLATQLFSLASSFAYPSRTSTSTESITSENINSKRKARPKRIQ